jgi:putative intracellular protease/amidase
VSPLTVVIVVLVVVGAAVGAAISFGSWFLALPLAAGALLGWLAVDIVRRSRRGAPPPGRPEGPIEFTDRDRETLGPSAGTERREAARAREREGSAKAYRPRRAAGDRRSHERATRRSPMSTAAFVVSEVGYHWEEVHAAYREFDVAGWDVAFYTPTGQAPAPDPTSVRRTNPLARAVGYGTSRAEGPDSELGRRILRALESPRPLSDFDVDGTDVLYVAGGHGALQDVDPNPDLHRVVEALDRQDRVLSAVCHATSTFAFARGTNGRPLVQGKALTGFPDFVDQVMSRVGMVDRRFLPLPFSNDGELRRAGARVNPVAAALNPRRILVDPPFVTGMGPKAAGDVARRAIAASELDPGRSVPALRRAFRDAAEPTLAALEGRHEAKFAGWLRLGGPLAMSLTGMHGWWGKQFRPAQGGGDSLEGENLLRQRGRLVESIPITAQIARSRVDGRPALVIDYPEDAPWPHHRVQDELRPLDERTLLGLSFGLPLAPPAGAPFVLHRR